MTNDNNLNQSKSIELSEDNQPAEDERLSEDNEWQINEEAIDKALIQQQQEMVARRAKRKDALDADESVFENMELADKASDDNDLACLNCGTPMKGAYCYECGQPERHFIRFFPRVLWDMLNEAFDLDSKIFRTFMPLMFRPGSLTLEYIAGRRARYINPLRLYIVISLIFFLVLSMVARFSGEDVIDNAEPTTSIAMEDEENEWEVTFDDGTIWHPETSPLKFHDMFSNDTSRQLNEFLWSLKNKIKMIEEEPREFVQEVFDVFPVLMFFLLPLFALLLKFVYLFQKRYYMEHLVIALHSHSFMFSSLLLMFLVDALGESSTTYFGENSYITGAFDWALILLVIWLPINLFLQQKRVYGQGKFMSVIKFIFVSIIYLFLLTFTTIISGVLGLVNL